MPDLSTTDDPESRIDLKDPFIAGILAWLVPGLGHIYQGRTAKGLLFMVCILGIFLMGLGFGSSTQTGYGRVVYMSFRPNDIRLYWFCQIGIGLPTVPMTLMQASFAQSPRGPIWNGFMAPPLLATDERSRFAQPQPSQMSLAQINRILARFFELGTLYTTVAGLLNILAIYDACCGPVPSSSEATKQAGDDDAKE